MAKDDKYKRVEDCLDGFRQADRLVDTIQVENTQAFISGLDAVLKDENDRIRYDWLKDSDEEDEENGKSGKRDDLVAKIGDALFENAKKAYKSDLIEKDDPMLAEMMMHSYTGLTRADLKRDADKLKDKFTLDRYNAAVREELGQRKNRLYANASSEFEDNEEDIKLIKDYLEIKDPEEDSDADEIDTIQKAVSLLTNYHAGAFKKGGKIKFKRAVGQAAAD